MSIVTKAICDICNKELDIDECFYTADITYQKIKAEVGEIVARGDFCKECFEERMKKELNIKDE